ncbi:hypothetical protein LAZ67_13001208 [Cordylochernes scorpioides]|uniref:DDE-1 domain-containing protein n=1 Tax=Cordylochernes scorpioides TaxID=51811 RepID=A0ABY6L3N3_9ARAC|nr:hypothetical protein LAZ67_13001208 [Cordylochernes scorpioides]
MKKLLENILKSWLKLLKMEDIVPIKSSMLMKQDCFGKKCQPVLTLQSPKKNASGFKAAKDRVTLLLCSNASGDRMLKPLLVNRSLKPRALKGKDLHTLPVHWMANKKAWVTTAIFTEWFNKCFVPEVENYMKEMGLEFKILLILDNAPGHPNLEHPNIKVVFFPPNTTSLIQPLDQGIISTFKKYYVKFTFQFIFDKLESDTITVTEVWKQFNILNCVDHVALAIAEIKSQTLNACWKAAWPECVSKRNESNRTSIVTSDIISIAKEIGGEGFDDFGEHDIEELLVDEALNDDDILESMVDTTKDFETVDSELEDVTPLDEKLLREGLQLSGRISTEDEHRPGKPIESVTQENIDKIHDLVMLDRRMTVRQIEETLGIPKTTVDRIMREHLGLRKFSARWVPKLLPPDQKAVRRKLSSDNLALFEANPEEFVDIFVTMDETWAHHFAPESKQQSMQWRHSGSPPPKSQDSSISREGYGVCLLRFRGCTSSILSE